LTKKVEEFLKRPIERPIPYLFVDASYFKVRDGGRYVSKAFLSSREFVMMERS